MSQNATGSGEPEFNDLGPLPGFAPPGDADVTPTDPPAGLSGRMPSIPADGGFLEENDLMHLDGVLDFEVTDPALAASAPPPSGWVAAHRRGVSDSSGGGDSDDWTGSGFTAGDPSGDKNDVGADLDPNDPKYKRRIQNRMASARFRAKAKERQQELDRLKHQVAQLRREKADLEAECRAARENLEAEAERQRTSTMAWVVDHFWLRRKVHFKTLANSVRWMVRGNYRPGMTEAALRAKEARARGIQPMDDDDDRFRVSDDDEDADGGPDSSRDDSHSAQVESTFGSDRQDRERSFSPSFAQRVAALGERITGSFRGLGGSWPNSPAPRPHTR